MRYLLIGAAIALLAAPGRAGDATLTVKGHVAHPLLLSMAELRALPPVSVKVTQATTMKGPALQDCLGPALSAVIARAGLALGGDRMTALAHTLMVTATDGYAVAFSMPELDPDYGAAAPVLATECGGKPLAAPKLVVPSDKHAGRAVHDVATIEVR